jgi:hypothetical protein
MFFEYRNWQVIGVDSWKGAVERTLTLAARWGVTDNVTAVQGKVRVPYTLSLCWAVYILCFCCACLSMLWRRVLLLL